MSTHGMKLQGDIVLHSLKQRYFALALTERFPSTPAITEELDRLEAAIRELQKATPKGPQPAR